MRQSLAHDTCFALSKVLLGIVQNCLREDEHRDAHKAFYDACRVALEVYEIKRDRMIHRLKPSKN